MTVTQLKPDLDNQIQKVLSDSFLHYYEYAIAVDQNSEVRWISDGYYRWLGLTESPIGKPIVEIIPNSYMPMVVQSGAPIFLEPLEIGDALVAVSAFPLKQAGQVVGAFGFVAIDKSQKPDHRDANVNQDIKSIAQQRLAKYTLKDIAGSSAAINQVKHFLRQASRYKMPVLITGETGTGKELFAQALHNLSNRAEQKFVSVNVSAIPSTLLEAEFFGVAPGAYTGADKKGREGKLSLANQGTLFLDEIGDMPLELQGKLLRTLQEKEFERVGSNRLEPFNARIIAATSQNLANLIQQGKFRQDLYYRLNVFPIVIPPLRERDSDIREIAEKILEDIRNEYGVFTKRLASDAVQVLEQYHWPGNVRQLRNILERASALCGTTEINRDLMAQVIELEIPLPNQLEQAPTQPASLAEIIEQTERQAIVDALKNTQGQKTEAANFSADPI